MITAVDTNVLCDYFGADRTFGPSSKEAIGSCLAEGRLVACEVVLAEVTAFFSSSSAAFEGIRGIGVEFDPISLQATLAAGTTWREYRQRGGRREHLVPDFLIGAHALLQADRLLTRDRGFYRAYFSRLRILDPAKP